MKRFFFEQTSEWIVDPNPQQLPEPANAEPESFTSDHGVPRSRRYQKQMEVRDHEGRTRVCVTLRSKAGSTFR